MTPEVKRKALNAIWECLRTSPVADSLENGCREVLLSKHLEHPERSPMIITTIPVEILEAKESWVSIWQQGGGLTVIIWALNRTSADTREAVVKLERCIRATGALVQVRWTRPYEFLRIKGWPLQDGDLCTSRH